MRIIIKTFWIAVVLLLIVLFSAGLEAHANTCQVTKIAAAGSYDPQFLTNVNGILFFSADDEDHGRELWTSDGTEAGTVMVKDINPHFDQSSDPKYLTNVNGTLFFNAGHTEFGGGGLMEELWKSDGTEAGTVMVKDLASGNPGYPAWLTNVNGTLFFTSWDYDERELWKSDGTEAGTFMVKDIYEGTTGVGSHAEPNSSNPINFTNLLGMLFFTAEDGGHGRELWRSDGTEAGTVMVYDIWALALGSDPAWMTRHGYILALSADDGLHGRELWGVDSFHHAYLIKDINTVLGYPELSSNPEYLTSIGGALFFAATAADGTARELWKSDGTEAGTLMVKDINPVGDSSPEGLTDINGKLYFSANDGVHGRELWKSDGTAAGTVMVKDINPFGNSSPKGFTELNENAIFFRL